METFSTLLAIYVGNSPVNGFLVYVWINCWVNNREAGDLRRYGTHYDVTVMMTTVIALDNIINMA